MKTFEELLDTTYGKPGTAKRNDFESQAWLHTLCSAIKDIRKENGLTQEDLAKRLGTKKSYISRIENGKCDVQLSTLFRIVEVGLEKKISFTIE